MIASVATVIRQWRGSSFPTKCRIFALLLDGIRVQGSSLLFSPSIFQIFLSRIVLFRALPPGQCLMENLFLSLPSTGGSCLLSSTGMLLITRSRRQAHILARLAQRFLVERAHARLGHGVHEDHHVRHPPFCDARAELDRRGALWSPSRPAAGRAPQRGPQWRGPWH